MLFLYKTNDLNLIVNTICSHIKKNPLNHPLEEEVILVDTEEIKQWLKCSLSIKLGITANIKIMHMRSYIKKSYKNIVPKKKWLSEIKQNKITWFLFLLSKKKCFSIFFEKFKNSFEKYLFLSHMSNLFKNYIKNRPDWINRWDKNKPFLKIKNQELQEKIWIFLIQYIKKNNNKLCFYPQLLLQYVKFVNKKNSDINNLQHRVFLIGTVKSSIYEILSIILNSKLLHIHLFFFTIVNSKINIKYKKKKLI